MAALIVLRCTSFLPYRQALIPDASERLCAHDALIETASALIADAAMSRAPVSLLVGDVDRFAELVERVGAEAAERALTETLELAARTLRQGDVVAHAGGDEFVLVVRAPASAAIGVAQRLCASVRSRTSTTPLTISIGVASAPDHGTTYQSLHAAADAARVRIKAHGRDGAALAPRPHHETLHRPLEIQRMAGRVEEQRALTRLLDDACSGSPRIAAILGELGTGTSLLASKLEPEVRMRGGSLVAGRCRAAEIREPYLVWSQIVDAITRIHGVPDGTWRELHQVCASVPRDPAAPAGSGSKYRLLEELLEFVRLACQRGPLVIVLNEMQWADAASWDALEHIAQQLESERLLLCLTQDTSPSFVEANDRRQAIAASAAISEITLSRLTREEVKRWLEAVFYHQDIGREFLSFVYRQTEGNPLRLSELLTTLLAEGALWHSGERWEWTAVSELRLPATLPELVARRLTRYSTSTLAVLGAAALVGPEFNAALLVAAGAGSEAAVQVALAEAMDAGLIRRNHEREAEGYIFAHETLRQVLMRSVAADTARQQHERIADALMRVRRGSIAAARHLHEAGGGPKAYRAALEAASRAELVYAYHTVAELLELATRHAPTPAELAEARVRLASVSETMGRFDEVEELCDLAIEWFEGQGDRHRALTLRRMRERARLELGRPARSALETLEELEAEARELGSIREQIAIGIMRSLTYQRLGDVPEAERIARACIELSSSLDEPALRADALTRLARTVALEQADHVVDLYREALKLAEAAGDVRGQARLHNNIAGILLHQGHWVEARTSFLRSLALARSMGLVEQWAVVDINLGLIAQRTGDLDAARELFAEAMALAARGKHSEFQLYSLYNMAHVDWDAGSWETCVSLYETTAALARRIGADEVEIGAMAGTGLCFLELGRPMDARRVLAEVQGRVQSRADWFQGREFSEALAIRVLLEDGFLDSAADRFVKAIVLAEATDTYSAAWLTITCAEAFGERAPTEIAEWVKRCRLRAEQLGYAGAARRLARLEAE